MNGFVRSLNPTNSTKGFRREKLLVREGGAPRRPEILGARGARPSRKMAGKPTFIGVMPLGVAGLGLLTSAATLPLAVLNSPFRSVVRYVEHTAQLLRNGASNFCAVL